MQNFVFDNGTAEADLVFKTRTHKATVELSEGLIKNSSCSCGKHRCSHVLAVMYKLESMYPEPIFFIDEEHRLRKYFGKDEKVIVPDGVTTIFAKMFENHTEIQEIVLPGSIERIDSECFRNCENLEKVNIAPNIIIDSGGTFDNCYKLADENGSIIFNNHLYKHFAQQMSEFVIPDGVEVICRDACSDNNYSIIKIPESVKTIESNAFRESHKIKEISIPNDIRELSYGFL